MVNDGSTTEATEGAEPSEKNVQGRPEQNEEKKPMEGKENDPDSPKKEKDDVTYLMVWATLSLLIIINPAIIGFNLLFCALVSTCVALQFLFSKSKTKETKELTHFQFVTAISYYSRDLPLLIGITALVCILSTTAPIVQGLFGAILSTLNGNSIIALQNALYSYLAYQALYWLVRNVLTKVYSMNISAQGGYDAINKFEKKLKEKHGENTNNPNDEYEDTQKNLRSADDITTKFWYFIQTILSALISVASSIISVLNFKLPAALKAAKTTLTKRFFAIAVLLNLLSYWFSQVFVQDKTTKMQNAKNNINDTLKSSNKENSKNAADEYSELQNDLNWRTAIQDGFYGLPRVMCSDNAIGALIIILTICPSFPLLTSVITADKVLTLASSLCRMMTESLAISKNIGEWTKSASGFDSINKSGENRAGKTQKPAFENTGEIKDLFKNSSIDNKRNWTEDISDSFACILTIIFATELVCTLNGIAFIGVSAIGLTPIVTALLGLTFYWAYQVLNTLKPNSNTANTAKQRAKTRFGNLFCNTMATALFMRMLSMFSPHIPAIIKLSTAFWPQIFVSGIACQLIMTLFVTPMLLPEDAYTSPIKVYMQGKVKNLLEIAKTFIEHFSNMMSKLQGFIKPFNKSFSVSGNKGAPEPPRKFRNGNNARKENGNSQRLFGSIFSMFSTSNHSAQGATTGFHNS